MMIAIVQLIDSVGNVNTVSFEMEFEHNAEIVMQKIENDVKGLTVLVVSIVTEVNGKLVTYAMRRNKDSWLKTFNKTPLKLS